MQMIRPIGVLLMLCAVATEATAEQWSNWRGPNRNGITSAEGFNPNFAQDGAQIVWTKDDIGVGYAAVSVKDGKAYTAGWSDGETTFYCLDAATGDDIWTYTYAAGKYDSMNAGGPSGTSTIDNGRVYHPSRDGRLFCFDAETGDLIWEKNLAKDFGVEVPRWGFSGSPVIIDEHIYMDIGRIIALNKNSGDEVWRTDDFQPSYSTPAPFTAYGKELLATFPAKGLYIVDRSDGEVLAHHPWTNRVNVNAATPVVFNDGKRVFISSGYNTGGAVLDFTGDALKVVWENRNMRNQMPTSLLIDGHLYGFDDSRLKCMNVNTGEEVWDQRGLGQGTAIAAGDTLIILSEKGELITAPATPDGFNPISRAQVLNEGKIWTLPVLADGMVYCRGSQGSLTCVDVSQKTN